MLPDRYMSILRAPLCGDPAVGKTSLVRALSTGDFYQEDFDTSSPVPILDGKVVLVDTNGQEDNDRLRGMAYKDADVFLVLFSIISPLSYNSVLTKVRVVANACLGLYAFLFPGKRT